MPFAGPFVNLRLLDIANSLFFYGGCGSLVMSGQAKAKRTAYTICIQGRLPADLRDKISLLHASALLDARNSTDPQILDDAMEPGGNGDVEPRNHISDSF